jgi:hypothetical protein
MPVTTERASIRIALADEETSVRGPSRQIQQASLCSPFGVRVDLTCSPQVLRLENQTRPLQARELLKRSSFVSRAAVEFDHRSALKVALSRHIKLRYRVRRRDAESVAKIAIGRSCMSVSYRKDRMIRYMAPHDRCASEKVKMQIETAKMPLGPWRSPT